MTFDIILDFVVIVFLIGTIAYAYSLNKKLTSLYQSRGDLQTFLDNFTKSLGRAESSMEKLKTSGEKTFSTLQEKLTSGGAIASDLSFMVERGEGVIHQLEDLIREGRALQKEASAPPTSEKGKSKKTTREHVLDKEAQEKEEPELVRALRNVR
jgi:hypothetical protein